MRLLIALLILFSIFSNTKNIHAEDTEITHGDDGNTSVELYTTVESQYTVKLPKYIDVSEETTTFDVYVKGDIAGNEVVNIAVMNTKYDGDINIDVDGDGKPDVNIDTNGDGVPDVNVDTNNDNIPDKNIDTDGTGTWKPSGEGGNSDEMYCPDKNVDNKDEHTHIDENGDGVCDKWDDIHKIRIDRIPGTKIIIHDNNWYGRYDNDDKEEFDPYDTNKDGVVSCEEALGDGWIWSIDKNTCVYKNTDNFYVPPTVTK